MNKELKEKVEAEAKKNASGDLQELSSMASISITETVYDTSYHAFTAGAEYLYSLLSTGMAGAWVRASDHPPKDDWFGPIRYRYDEKNKVWEYDSEIGRGVQNNIQNYPDVEWLDESATPPSNEALVDKKTVIVLHEYYCTYQENGGKLSFRDWLDTSPLDGIILKPSKEKEV
jgi:hypothetical protein